MTILAEKRNAHALIESRDPVRFELWAPAGRKFSDRLSHHPQPVAHSDLHPLDVSLCQPTSMRKGATCAVQFLEVVPNP